MKLELERVRQTYDECLRRANAQVWDLIDPFVAFVHSPSATDARPYHVDLGVDVDEDIDDANIAKVDELSKQIGQAVKDASESPLNAVVELLGYASTPEVTIPAGCDVASEGEVKSAFLRAVERLSEASRSREATLLIPAASQEWFLAALDRDQPAMIGDWRIRLVPRADLLDRTGLDEGIGEDGTTAVTPEEFYGRLVAAAKRSPWYVIVHPRKDHGKPFEFVSRERPTLVGPKLAVSGRWTVRRREGRVGTICRVAPSKLVLAQTMQEATK